MAHSSYGGLRALSKGTRAERVSSPLCAAPDALNGLAMGMIGPFMAFWFHLRFGVGCALIGPVLAGGFIVALLLAVGRIGDPLA